MKLEQARKVADFLVLALQPVCERIEIAGSIRRKKADVKDIELVIVPQPGSARPVFGEGLPPLERQLGKMLSEGTLLAGEKNGQRMKTFFLSASGAEIKLDMFIVRPPAQWGVIFTLRTGPAEFSHWLVTRKLAAGALPNHMSVVKGALMSGDDLIPTPEEKDFFEVIGLAWVEPAMREARWNE